MLLMGHPKFAVEMLDWNGRTIPITSSKEYVKAVSHPFDNMDLYGLHSLYAAGDRPEALQKHAIPNRCRQTEDLHKSPLDVLLDLRTKSNPYSSSR